MESNSKEGGSMSFRSAPEIFGLSGIWGGCTQQPQQPPKSPQNTLQHPSLQLSVTGPPAGSNNIMPRRVSSECGVGYVSSMSRGSSFQSNAGYPNNSDSRRQSENIVLLADMPTGLRTSTDSSWGGLGGMGASYSFISSNLQESSSLTFSRRTSEALEASPSHVIVPPPTEVVLVNVMPSPKEKGGQRDTEQQQQQPQPQPQNNNDNPPSVCRHFLQGKCTRKQCRFFHPK